MDDSAKSKPRLEDCHILQEFRDISPDEVPGLPPKRYIEFTIELVLGAASESKAPYCMSALELIELKMQLQILSIPTTNLGLPHSAGVQGYFPDEVPGLPPKRHTEFTIELVAGAAPESKAPYCMSTPELFE